MSPDTIIPSFANPQSWNRFSYAVNNPIRYNDPDGHCAPACPLALIPIGQLLVDAVVVVVGIIFVTNPSPAWQDDWRYHNPRQQKITEKIESTYNKDFDDGLLPDPNYKPPKCGFWCKFLVGTGLSAVACVLMFEEDCKNAVSPPRQEKLALTPTITTTPDPAITLTLTPTPPPTSTQTSTPSQTSTPTPTQTQTPPIITPAPPDPRQLPIPI